MIIIGEKINGTRKKVHEAVASRDVETIQKLAADQAACGADYIDLNAGTRPDREPEDLVWLARTVQAVTDKRICLDSANPKALAAAVGEVNETPMINSISGEPDRLDGILPIVAEHQCPVIVLAMDGSGIPAGVDERMSIIRRLVDVCEKAGVAEDQLYVDPLIMTIATNIDCGRIALDTMKAVRREFPDAHLTGGMSNISFGMPLRSVVNRAFLAVAMYAGLDSAIIDPTDRDLLAALLATDVVLGGDPFCRNFNGSFRAGKI